MKEKGFGKGSFENEIDSRARHTSGRWAELVEKMRQSLKLSGNYELTSPTSNLQGWKRSVVVGKRAVCGSNILGMQL
jgi:hypothetical protein